MGDVVSYKVHWSTKTTAAKPVSILFTVRYPSGDRTTLCSIRNVLVVLFEQPHSLSRTIKYAYKHNHMQSKQRAQSWVEFVDDLTGQVSDGVASTVQQIKIDSCALKSCFAGPPLNDSIYTPLGLPHNN